MQKIHYINYGLSKAGTTWLWFQLIKHPDVDFFGPKEDNNIFFNDRDFYADPYREFDISLNFSPNLTLLPEKKLQALDAVSTHGSIIFRNPYEWIESFYFFGQPRLDFDSCVDFCISHQLVNFAGILDRVKRSASKPLLLLYYNDLELDPQAFYNQVTDYLGLAKQTIQSKRYYATKNKQPMPFDPQHVQRINYEIARFQQSTDQDLSSWFRS